MTFATGKALLWGAVCTAGMIAALALLRGEIGATFIVLQGIGTGILCGLAAGWLMRETTVELDGQSVEQIESAVGGWPLQNLRRDDLAGGGVCFHRGGAFAGRLTVTPTATGVTVAGPANLIRALRRRAAA